MQVETVSRPRRRDSGLTLQGLLRRRPRNKNACLMLQEPSPAEVEVVLLHVLCRPPGRVHPELDSIDQNPPGSYLHSRTTIRSIVPLLSVMLRHQCRGISLLGPRLQRRRCQTTHRSQPVNPAAAYLDPHRKRNPARAPPLPGDGKSRKTTPKSCRS